MKIQLDWNRRQVSELTIINLHEKNGAAVKCQTTLKNNRRIVDTRVSQDSFLVIQSMMKQGFSQRRIRQEIYEELKISSLGETLTIRDRTKGGGCGSSSVKHTIDTAIIQEQKKEIQTKNKKKSEQLGSSQVSKLSNKMKEIIDEPDSEILQGKIYIVDTIFPIIDTAGAISFRALHPQLLKILMKGFNLLLRDNVEPQEEFTWTSADQKKMEEGLNNILQRIKSIVMQEPLLIHCFCITMIRDMLNTQKSTFDALTEAIAFGVPLFGLIWSQDPTLLFQLALKAKNMVLEKLTKNTIHSMMKFQAKALAGISNQDSQKDKENARLLFAYQSALPGVIGKKNNESWEVQVFAMMQINEVLKQMDIDNEQINDSSAKWNQFFDNPEIGLIEICKQQSSFRGIVFIELLDTYLLNHKTIRFMAVEILIHAFKLLNLQKEKSEHKQIVLKQIKYILFERWLLETAPQVRTLFFQEEVLNVIDGLVKSQQNDKSSEASNLFQKILEEIKKEMEALERLKTQKEGKYEDAEVQKELQDTNDILVQLSQEDGIKEVIKLRQIEHWKTGILKRRAKGDIQKDDALLDTIDCYVGQFIKKKVFEKADTSKRDVKGQQEEQENSEEESFQEMNALEYILNLFQEKKEKSKMCVMIGSGGRGKSMLLKKVELELVKDLSYENVNSKYGTLPIIIKLFELDPEKPDIVEYLQNQSIFKEQRLDPSVLKSSTQQKVLLLDAFDEFRGPEFNLWEKLMLEDWVNTTVVVTCRDDALTENSCNLIFSTPHSTENIPSFTIHELMGFGEEQLKNFAESLLKEKDHLELFQEIIRGNDLLVRLLSLPINSLIFIRTIPLLTKSSAQTLNLTNQGDLQQLFYQHAFEREAQMIFNSKSEIQFIPQVIQEYFCIFQRTAVAMFTRKSFELTLEDLNKVKQITLNPSLEKKLSASQSDALSVALKKYSNRSILVLDEDRQTVRFVHLSIFEFFVAKSIVADFESLPPKSLHELSLEQIKAFSISSRYIVERGDSSGLAILQKISRIIKPTILSADFLRSIQSPSYLDHPNYTQLILLSRQENLGRSIDTAASNMLSILAYSKCSLLGLNLSRCSLTKAYLYGYKGGIDLTGADLNEAMLAGCELDLSQSKTEKAQFNDAQCIWQSSDIYQFSSCCLVSNSNPGYLTLATGSDTGFFNLFLIDLNFKKQSASLASNYSYHSQFAWKLIKSKKLSREKILNIRHVNNTFILSQKRNIVQLDGNGDTIHFTFKPHTTDIVHLNCQMSLKHLVTIDEQGDIKIWDIADQFKNINTFEKVHTKKVNYVQFSSAEPYYLVSASHDRTCGVWQYSLEKKNWNFSYFITGFDKGLGRVEFIGTGSSQLLLTSVPKRQGLVLWRLQQEKAEQVKEQDIFRGEYRVLSVSPDGKILITYNSESSKIEIFGDLTDESCQIIISFRCTIFFQDRDFLFSTDSKFIAFVPDDFTCMIKSADNTFQEIAIVQSHNNAISNLAITKSTSVLVTASQQEGCFFWMRSADSSNTSYILQGKIPLSDQETGFLEMSISEPIDNGEKQYLALSIRTNSVIQIYELVVKKATLQVQQLQPLLIPNNFHINSLRFYESILLVAHQDGCIAWDSQDKFKEIFKITAQKKVVSAALSKHNDAFFPIFATKGNFLEVWQFVNTSPPECIKKITLGDGQFGSIALASSPDNKHLAVILSDGNCKIFSMQKDFSLVATLKSNQKEIFKSIVFSSDSLRLATTSSERMIKTWLVNSNFEQERAITGEKYHFFPTTLFLPTDSKKLITLSDQYIVLWDFQLAFPTDSAIKSHKSNINVFDSSPSGQYIVTVSEDYSCNLWMSVQPLTSGESNFEHFCTFQMGSKKKYKINSISFISENSFVCGCSDKVCRIFQIFGSNVSLVQTLTGHSEEVILVCSAETTSKKQYIASFSTYNSCIIYGPQKEEQVPLPAGSNIPQFQQLKNIKNQQWLTGGLVSFSPQAKYFAIYYITGDRFLYDSSTEAFNFIDSSENEEFDSGHISLCFSPDNLTLAYVEQSQCLIWDIQTKQISQTLTGFDQGISCVNYFKDGSNQLAILANKTFFNIYKPTPQGLQLAETLDIKSDFQNPISLMNFLGSSGILAIVSKNDKSLKILQTSHLFQTTLKQQLDSPHSDSITYIAFSSDGKFIAMASKDKTCSLWKITENKNLERCQNFKLSANSLSFLTDEASPSPSIKLLSISEDDKTVRLYQAQSINESMNEIRKLVLPFKPFSKFALQSSNSTHSLVLLQSGNYVILNHIGENLSIQQTFNDIKLAAVNSKSTYFSLLKSDGLLQILDGSLNILKTIPLVSEPSNSYVSLTISTDDRFIVLTDYYQNITLFSTASPYEQIPTANKYPMSILASSMINRSQENSYQILVTCFGQNQPSPGLLYTDLLAFQPDQSILRLKASKEASFAIVADKKKVSFYVPQSAINIQTI